MLMWDHLVRILTTIFLNSSLGMDFIGQRITKYSWTISITQYEWNCSICFCWRWNFWSIEEWTTKKIFNYRLSRARKYVRCSFGILVNKWRIFHRLLNGNTNLVVDITKASGVLHNYVRGYIFKDTLSIEGFEEVERINNINRGSRFASDIRNTFADYFHTVGAVLHGNMENN